MGDIGEEIQKLERALDLLVGFYREKSESNPAYERDAQDYFSVLDLFHSFIRNSTSALNEVPESLMAQVQKLYAEIQERKKITKEDTTPLRLLDRSLAEILSVNLNPKVIYGNF